MTGTVHVVDYGIGNLYSVARAIEAVGGIARVTTDPEELVQADRLLLPGVGAFRDGMAGLREAGVVDAVRAFAQSGRPLLGICLGMQMLATESSEYGVHEGLRIIPGRVDVIPSTDKDGRPCKVPFIGWASLEPAGDDFRGTILDVVKPEDSIYLVHSFQFVPNHRSDLLAVYRYGGHPITAAVARDNIFGCQFHPEKSGRTGLRLLERFLAI